MTEILGVILCGGQASRLGGTPKHSLTLGALTFLEIAENTLMRELPDIALSVRTTEGFKNQNQYTIIKDRSDHGVAGAILSSLAFAKENEFGAILTLPVDTPLLPQFFARRLISAAHETNPLSAVYAANDGQVHGLHAIWPTACLDVLTEIIQTQGTRRISALHQTIGSRQLEFGTDSKTAFLNVNTPEIYDEVSQIMNIET